MKRFIALALVLIIVISLPVLIQAEKGDSYTDIVLIDYNFDDKTTVTSKNNDISAVSVENFDDAYGKVMSDGTFHLYKDANAVYTSVIEYEADYYIPDTAMSSEVIPVYFSHKDGSAYKLIKIKNGIVKVGYNEDAKNTEPFVSGWVNVKIVLNMIDYKISVELTDSAETIISLSADLPRTYDGDAVHQFNKHMRIIGPGAGVKVDNIKLIHKVKNSEMTYKIFENGDLVSDISKVPCDGIEIKLTFSESMDEKTIIPSNFKLIDDVLGTEVAYDESITYNAEEKTIVISLLNSLRCKSSYTLTATNLKTTLGGNAYVSSDSTLVSPIVKFTTEYPPFAIMEVSEKSVSNGMATYDVTVQNTNGVGRGYMVIVSRADVATDKIDSVKKLLDIEFVTISPEQGNDYSVTIKDGNIDFYLIDNDGSFKAIDIWGK